MRVQRNERGQTTIFFAVFMAIVFLGMAALALDVGMLYREKRMVQAAADAAAIAASAQYPTTDYNVSAKAAAQQQAGGILAGEVQANLLNSATSDVQVVISHPTRTFFLGAFKSTMKQVNVSAMAEASKPPVNACISSLSPNGVPDNTYPVYYCKESSTGGIVAGNSGGSTQIKSTGCSICANSSVVGCANGTGISTDSSVNAGGGVLGKVTDAGSSAAGNCADPYAVLPKPAVGACIDPSWMLNGGQQGGGGTYSIGPGTYCNFNTQNVKSLTLTPGTYVIKTTFSTNSGTLITGNGATIYLAPGAIADANSSTKIANTATPYGIGNGTNMTLTAPTSGTYAGVAFWDDSGTATTPDVLTFGGGTGTSITGAVYAPHTIIEDGGNAGIASVSGSITSWAILVGGSGGISVSSSGGGNNAGKVTLVQ